jgi:hypothetical protein
MGIWLKSKNGFNQQEVIEVFGFKIREVKTSEYPTEWWIQCLLPHESWGESVVTWQDTFGPYQTEHYAEAALNLKLSLRSESFLDIEEN